MCARIVPLAQAQALLAQPQVQHAFPVRLDKFQVQDPAAVHSVLLMAKLLQAITLSACLARRATELIEVMHHARYARLDIIPTSPQAMCVHRALLERILCLVRANAATVMLVPTTRALLNLCASNVALERTHQLWAQLLHQLA